LKKRKSKAPVTELPDESRAAEAVTVAWMLSVMVAVVCELGWLATRWWIAAQPTAEMVAALGELLFFSALITGTMALVLVPVVLRSRSELPPRGITFFALVVGVLPLAIAGWRLLR
jgi:hypothetical protein